MSDGEEAPRPRHKGQTTAVRVRAARPEDARFILSLAPRLSEFGVPDWRSGDTVTEAEARTLATALDRLPEGAALLVAELASGQAVGFIYLETPIDYFTGRPHTHVGILAVDRDGEGKGVGGALLREAEARARKQGHALVTLNVFEGNNRARTLYTRLGYRPEMIRYVKPLDRD